jgi:hypothetical protein
MYQVAGQWPHVDSVHLHERYTAEQYLKTGKGKGKAQMNIPASARLGGWDGLLNELPRNVAHHSGAVT